MFKATVGREKRYPAKIKANLRNKKKLVLDVFVQYKMAEGCDCDILNGGGNGLMFIFVKFHNVWGKHS